MPVYAYKGVTNTGRNTRGQVDAESGRAARLRLRREGVYLTELVEARGAAARGGGGAATAVATPRAAGPARRISLDLLRPISGMDLAIATRQLATLLGAGVPLVSALGALTEQVENPRLKAVVGRVRDRVNEGGSLADALGQAGPFSDLYVSMVRAGETSGALEQVLARLADYLESQVRTRNKVATIMIYPAIMLLVAVGVVVALVTVVLPQITQLLESLNRPLPFYTVAIIRMSEIFRTWWWAFGLGAAGLLLAGQRAVQTQRGRLLWDRFKLGVPVFGKVIRHLAISRFTRTLSTLLAGGISIVKALDISRHVTNNVVLGGAVERARDSITEGASISAPLRASGEFPPLVTHMVDVGERSGELEAMLAKVADTYEEQVENAVGRLTALLEPILILLMVGIVLVIILATLVPLLELTSAIQ